ncbi:MAG: AAA domain-containing protein [Bacteroidota bacterium]
MHKKWLNYWKNSLTDAQRKQVNFEKEKYFVVKNIDFESGVFPLPQTEALFEHEEAKYNKKKGVKSPSDSKWVQLKSINILFSLFTAVPKPDYLSHSKSSKPAYPIWIQGVLSKKGELSIPEELFPIIPRPYLTPSAGKTADFIIGDVDTVDESASISQVSVKNWDDYINYISKVFKEVSRQELSAFSSEGYRIEQESIFFSPDEERGAASGIINLYHHLIEAAKVPSLLKKLIQPDNQKTKKPVQVNAYMQNVSLHLGQMGDSFPLSITQRKTLSTYLTSEANTVCAVNGPPGTGKTTLLQSVVANEIVNAAIKGGQAPRILACSTNNQAVQNINESFSKTESSLQKLSGRWLPDFSGYASYLPSTKKSPAELEGINYIKLDGSGTFQILENLDYLERAKPYFLEKIGVYKNQSFSNINNCAKVLQKEILDIKSTLESFSIKWSAYSKTWKEFIKSYDSINDIDDYLKDNLADQNKLQEDLNWFKNTEELIITYYSKEPILRKIGCFLGFPSSLKLRALEIDKIFKKCPILISQKLNRKKYDSLKFCNTQIDSIEELQMVLSQWKRLCDSNGIKGTPPCTEDELWSLEWNKINTKQSAPCYFYDELDIKFRHHAFQLAIHYWEARWLSEVPNFIMDDKKDSKGYFPTLNRWEIRSMLTPCYVSTFYMAPKFFSFWQYDDENESWANPPLLNFVDTLMVDEAGQTTPEVGVAIFGLAKEAIVVGDIKQIEPIWNIPSKIDEGNLSKNGLLNGDVEPLMNQYESEGVLASKGSIMKMAQTATPYLENNAEEKGLLLREHRRCYDEIIGYCNILAYNGQLVPMKGAKPSNTLFPAMDIIHVEGSSTTQNKNRFNTYEVKAIVDFLVENREKIESINREVIEKEVGIITPFFGQKRALITALQKAGFDTFTMKIGTVHALQGAERSIIIFSSVYGEGDVGTMFFDRDNKPNMLNVAVSRAKDSFIVFGNRRIFNSKSNTPSGKLGKYLKL